MNAKLSTGITLDSLQKLLRIDEEKKKEAKAVHCGTNRKLSLSLENVWRHVGVFPGSDPDSRWTRPMSDTLYRCPLSVPQTTLVTWKSLPAATQAKLRTSGAVLPQSIPTDVEHPGVHDASEGIVEVPLHYLSGDEQDGSHGKHRKLQGNLSDKISQYTRGLEGQRTQPFRPGGLEVDDVRPIKIDPYRTTEMTERSKMVLLQGSTASWKDKSILTAPPGMPFKVGLSWADVHGTTDEPEDDLSMKSDMVINNNAPVPSGDGNLSMLASPGMSQGIFSRNYFDDDSLFGSSTSGSDEEDSDAESDDNREENPDRASGRSVVGSFGPSTFPEIPQDDGENIDELLLDLTISDDKLYRKKHDENLMSNPLELSQKLLHMQADATRKLWASEKLLPIVDFNTLIPNPAYRFPFTLDDFQQQAIARLERSESVFVAAHTSAGKTVVAEYAIALAKQRATRCVYTSPIKALSNQKFRDFALKFGKENVGLMTGDLQVNVETSTVLVMTTEILRSMLYRGADLIRDIEFVVFDEVHYVNDTERGVVWEEVIVLLPNNVTMIFLSATTPNSFEFSDWIGRTKQKVVHVIKTDYRPVPLSHYLWAGAKLHKVLQGKGSFIAKGYSDASKALLPSSATDTTKKKGEQKSRPLTGSKDLAWQAQGNKQQWRSLVNYLDRELLTPAVVFSFSKKKCEELAFGLVSLDLNTAKEASAVQGFTLQAIARLSRNDAQLPQVIAICEMVKRGIGVHHGGLLPILKEMVEILFSRNLIKVLFATETFAMGVNMPAKAVIFNSIRKHDGTQFRLLEPGEYTQMAGRAGRRGLDKVGTVVLSCFGETPPPLSMLQNMLTGSSTRLNSNFRLKYGMMLSLLKGESELSVEAMIKRSFSEFATQRALTANEYPQLLVRGTRTLEKLEDQFYRDASNWIGAADIIDYFAVCKELLSTIKTTVSMVRDLDSPSFDEIFSPGRMILVSAPRSCGVVRGPAIVLRPPSSARLETTSHEEHMICIVLMPLSFSPIETTKKQIQAIPGQIGYIGSSDFRHYSICTVQLDQVVLIGGKKVKIDVGTFLKGNGAGRSTLDQQVFAGGSFPSQVALDPFAGMKAFGKKDSESCQTSVVSKTNVVHDTIGHLLGAELSESNDGLAALSLHTFLKRGNSVVEYRKFCDHIDRLTNQMRSFTSHRHPNLEKFYTTIERKEALRTRVETLRHLLSNESLHLFPDFLQRKTVLLKLGYIEENEIVRVKGRVACEVNTCDELLLTEMVFEGLLNELEPAELIAVLSSLVWQEKSKDDEFDSELPEKLVSCCNQMKVIATNLGQLQKEIGLSIDPGEYCDSVLRFGLVHVVYEWALGVTFKNICELTDAHEGSIVRCITRLDELCREVRNIARVLGNPTLYQTAEAASTCIKRDIVFASSLYVS